MASIIWFFISSLCASIFLGIGLYAKKLTTPMWFWAGSTVDPATITDIKAYNSENGSMWIQYSIPYWISAVIHYWMPITATLLLVVPCTAGIVWLIWRFLKISKKYKAKI